MDIDKSLIGKPPNVAVVINDKLMQKDDLVTEADTREQLEADALDYVVRTAKLCHGMGLRHELWQFNPEPLHMHIRQCLDRQAAITERQCMERATSERVGWDCAECAEGLGKRIAELTAELYRERKSREYAYNKLNEMLALDGKRVKQINELTAERDHLRKVVQRQAESFRKMEAELSKARTVEQ